MKKIFLAALAAAALSSCSDDNEPIASTDVPMQVSTSIRTEGRALIGGDVFPTGQTIAVSLFDGATGGAYEGKTDGFVNIPYTSSANGTGGAVVWSSKTPIHLSPAEGKAIAWYPHSVNVTDHQAIPVETATQTDYMYSDWATGISALSPQASFTMHHALAAIDVSVTKGDYQIGEARLTSFSVQSAGFGTSATLNADGGDLTAIQGQNTALSHTPDALLTPTGTSFPVLVVPDQSVAQPTIKVFLEIDGKRYVKDIAMKEAFQQGRRYLYKFKLNDTKLDVMSVTIVEWNTETKPQGGLKPVKVYAKDEYVVKVKIPSNDFTFYSNVYNFSGKIDWGDGAVTEHSPTNNPSHVYREVGEFTVTAKGNCTQLIYANQAASASCLTDIVYIGESLGLTRMKQAFRGCSSLTTIRDGIFDGCTQVTDFYGTFWGCEALTSIPQGLFDKCTQVTDFGGMFRGCSGLESIPQGLFDHCTKVTSFTGTFDECSGLRSIPNGLFDHCTQVTSFYGTFRWCEALTSIPQGLFDKCTQVKSFEGTFSRCMVQSIPQGLFDHCTKVTSFEGTFWGCEALTSIPQGLFDKCTQVKSFENTFRLCSGLKNIPKGLFDHCTNVTNFGNTFQECNGLTGESPYTEIETTDGAKVKVHLYERANYPDRFKAPHLNSYCFKECTNLSDYTRIPWTWK